MRRQFKHNQFRKKQNYKQCVDLAIFLLLCLMLGNVIKIACHLL